MRMSALLCASAVAVAALAPSANGAFAAKLNPGPGAAIVCHSLECCKSHPDAWTSGGVLCSALLYPPINPHDPKAVQNCKARRGTVGKDPKGQDACITVELNAGGQAGRARQPADVGPQHPANLYLCRDT